MANMMRREFIAAGGAMGLPLQAAAMQSSAPSYTGNPQLKITDVQVFMVNAGRNYVYVKVSTDQGIHGWGEAYSAGPDEATAATVRDFKDWLVGKDPRNIEYLWATMYNFTRFPGGLVVNSAISGIEHALWTLQAKPRACRFTCCWGGNAATRSAATRRPTLPSRPRV
jgi:L-alanine-DL-glutamate epimerase-like enolase superfamily enzyme